MGRPLLPNGKRWELVQVQELSAGRIRMVFVLPPGVQRAATVDRELNTPQGVERVAEALLRAS